MRMHMPNLHFWSFQSLFRQDWYQLQLGHVWVQAMHNPYCSCQTAGQTAVDLADPADPADDTPDPDPDVGLNPGFGDVVIQKIDR